MSQPLPSGDYTIGPDHPLYEQVKGALVFDPRSPRPVLFEPVDDQFAEFIENEKARCGEEYCHCAARGATHTLEIDEGQVIVRHRECGRRLFDEAIAILQMAAIRVDIKFETTEHWTDLGSEYDAEGIIHIPGAHT